MAGSGTPPPLDPTAANPAEQLPFPIQGCDCPGVHSNAPKAPSHGSHTDAFPVQVRDHSATFPHLFAPAIVQFHLFTPDSAGEEPHQNDIVTCLSGSMGQSAAAMLSLALWSANPQPQPRFSSSEHRRVPASTGRSTPLCSAANAGLQGEAPLRVGIAPWMNASFSICAPNNHFY